MNYLEKLTDFINKQDPFIKIAFYVGAGFIILLAGYYVGAFIARIAG